MTPDELSERLLEFAAEICKVVEALPNNRVGRHIAGQLVRSGTSPSPNYEEACGAESRNDFVHKLHTVLKELREPRGWLRLIRKLLMLDVQWMSRLIDEATQLIRIIGKSIHTAKSGSA